MLAIVVLHDQIDVVRWNPGRGGVVRRRHRLTHRNRDVCTVAIAAMTSLVDVEKRGQPLCVGTSARSTTTDPPRKVSLRPVGEHLPDI